MKSNLKSPNVIPLKVLQSITFEDEMSWITVIRKGVIMVSFRNPSNIIELNEKLKIRKNVRGIKRKVKKFQNLPAHINSSIDGKYKSVSTVHEVGIYTSDWVLFHKIPNFSSEYAYLGTYCVFTVDSKYGVYVLNTPNNEVALLQLFDIKASQVIYEAELDSYYCYFQLFQTPIPNLVLIECSAGQDGTWIYLLEMNGPDSKISKWENDYNRILGSFNTKGNEILTVPHYGRDIIVHEFPSFKEITSISESEVFDSKDSEYIQEDEDSFDFYGRFLGDDCIVFKSFLARLVAINRKTMQVIGELQPPNYDNSGDDYITDFHCIGEDKLLVQHGSHTLTLYQVPVNTIFSR